MFLNPSHYGFPSKFTEWRDTQILAIQNVLDSKVKFTAQCQPTGSGKSLMYMGLGVIGKFKRVLILTSTKGLQDQLVKDFGPMGLVPIMGKANYTCNEIPSIKCDKGPCHHGFDCHLKQSGCDYFDQQRKAREAKFVVTNYSYWMSQNKYNRNGEGIGTFDLIVLDEAHQSDRILKDFLTVRINKATFTEISGEQIPDYGEDNELWAKWARGYNQQFKEELKERAKVIESGKKMPSSFYSELAKMSNLQQQLEEVTNCNRNWYCFHEEKEAVFGIVQGFRGYSESLLWPNCKKVLFVSGTIREKTLRDLGLVKDEFSFEDFPSCFDPRKSPIVHIKTLKMNASVTPYEFEHIMVPRIDQIIDRRTDRKGIIHAVSYDRAEAIIKHSRHKGIMVTHNRYNVEEVVKGFLKSKTPKVLVSPCVGTGRDFPGEMCEYQIIPKLPFPYMGDKLLMRRAKLDKTLLNFITAQELSQYMGRGTRSADDQCENFILDDAIEWWITFASSMLPYSFMEAFRSTVVVPLPADKL